MHSFSGNKVHTSFCVARAPHILHYGIPFSLEGYLYIIKKKKIFKIHLSYSLKCIGQIWPFKLNEALEITEVMKISHKWFQNFSLIQVHSLLLGHSLPIWYIYDAGEM